jgi:predicted nucleic acid-binding protein
LRPRLSNGSERRPLIAKHFQSRAPASGKLIRFAGGDEAAGRLVDSEPVRGMSAIALMELLQGARSTAEMKRTRQFPAEQQFRILPLTETVSYMSVALIGQFPHSHGLRLGDALIAATALEHGTPVATAGMGGLSMVFGGSMASWAIGSRSCGSGLPPEMSDRPTRETLLWRIQITAS